MPRIEEILKQELADMELAQADPKNLQNIEDIQKHRKDLSELLVKKNGNEIFDLIKESAKTKDPVTMETCLGVALQHERNNEPLFTKLDLVKTRLEKEESKESTPEAKAPATTTQARDMSKETAVSLAGGHGNQATP